MKPVLTLYATREGHTRRIAEHLGATLRGRGLMADIVDAKELPSGFSMDAYSAAIVSGSIHRGQHEPEIVDFVKRHKVELERIPAVFLSVSLSEAGAEDPAATPERRAQSAVDAERMIQDFLSETGWHPAKVRPVAGALMYSKYNFLVRFVMKRIAREAGAAKDTLHDQEFTDWQALDRIVDELALSIPKV